MAGSKEGGKKAHATIIARLGEDGARKLAQDRGRQGGLAKVPKGFAITGKGPEAGRIGGLNSRRNKREQVDLPTVL